MNDRIETVGALRKALEGVADDTPLEFWLNMRLQKLYIDQVRKVVGEAPPVLIEIHLDEDDCYIL